MLKIWVLRDSGHCISVQGMGKFMIIDWVLRDSGHGGCSAGYGEVYDY